MTNLLSASKNLDCRRELQINLHPNDYNFFGKTFPHQLRVWRDQVDRVTLTLDLHNSTAGRYHSTTFDDNLRRLRQTIVEIAGDDRNIYVDEVDYSPSTVGKVAQAFFGTTSVPVKAWDGGPLYSYLYGLWRVTGDIFVHMDSDMMFGGGSARWLDEAEKILTLKNDVIFVAPLAGPPSGSEPLGLNLLERGCPEKLSAGVYKYKSVSTRIFASKKSRMISEMLPLIWLKPSRIQKFKSKILGNPPDLREFEVILTQTMMRSNLNRLDVLGGGESMWSLHPPFRNKEFYVRLGDIIGQIESGDIPDEQRGKYELDDSMCNWSDARLANSKFRRISKQLSNVAKTSLRWK